MPKPQRQPVCVRQRSDNDCGPAALASVFAYWGRRCDLTAMRERAGTARSGTNLLGLKTAAIGAGFIAKAVRADGASLPKMPLPCVAHVRGEQGRGHYVVVYKVTSTELLLADPATGMTRWDLDEFFGRWTGALLLLAPGGVSGVGRQKPITMRTFAAALLSERRLVMEALFAGLAATMLGAGTALFVQLLVDEVLPAQDTSLLTMAALGLLVAHALQSLFGVIRGMLLVRLGQRMDAQVQSITYRHVIQLPMRFFQAHPVGELVARLHEASMIADVLANTIMALLFDALVVIVSGALMLMFDTKLALLGFGMLPMSVFMMYGFRRLLRSTQRAHMNEAADLQGRQVGSLYAIAAVKAYSFEDAVVDRTEQSLARALRLRVRLNEWGVLMQNAVSLVNNLTIAAILSFGGLLSLHGEISLGELMSFYALIGFMIAPIRNLSVAQVQVQEGMTAAARVGELLSLQAEDRFEPGKFAMERAKGDVELSNVSFSYDGHTPVLRNVSLQIRAGSTVAFVGESGSGKTTLCKLLLRFYEPDAGTISLDGIDVRALQLDSLRRQFGWVDQDSQLVSGTVADNIRMGKSFVSMLDVTQAAKVAAADDFINRMPEGFLTMLADSGTAVSGGQRQRICIARALCGSPPVLILDEATSQLDSRTERAIQGALEHCRGSATKILVAHRLSTVVSADQIVVLRHGQIAESGTHTDLVNRGGYYAELWRRQTGGLRAVATA